MSTDALELALALHQAPIQRFALRDRPLPGNIGVVLQLASAMQPQLEEAAARFSESQDTVLEAVRFYLHQVLFEPGTDAYRVLGLTPDANAKLIRQHHVWLQRWLHPDRRGEDWEAVFTTKVNWAWQQLRTESARGEYDRGRRAEAPQNVDERVGLAPMPLPAWSTAPGTRARRHWPRRIAFGGLLAACAGLFFLEATREDKVSLDITELLSGESATPAPVEAPAGTEIRPAQVVSEPTPESRSRSTLADVEAAQREERAVKSLPSEIAGTSAGPTAPAGISSTSGQPVGERTATVPIPASVPDASSAGGRRPAVREPASAVAESALRVPSAPSISDSEGDRSSAPPSRRQPASRSAGALAGSGDSAAHRQSTRSDVVASSAASAADLAEIPADDSPRQVDSQAQAGSERQVPASAAPDQDTLLRFELARERLRSMVGYLRSRNSEPGQWNDASGRLTVERERLALQARNGYVQIDRFVLDPPTWRVSDAAIALEATYHANDRRGVAETGRFYLDMAWYDSGWKITRIEMLPSP